MNVSPSRVSPNIDWHLMPCEHDNQALARDCLRLASCDATVHGFGRLPLGEAG